MRKIVSFVFILFLSGCSVTAWSPLQSKEYKFHGLKFKATIPLDWNRNNLGGKGLHISKDGMALNFISVKRFKFLGKLKNTGRKYEEGMPIEDIANVTIDNIKSNNGIFNFKVISNVPVIIGGLDAYRLEYSFETEQGLKKKGIVHGLVSEKFVYQLTFEAPRKHYYEKGLPDYESFVSSFKVL